MSKKITIKDIAKHANVSVTSVSNFLNGRDHKMNIKTKETIEEVIKKLNYKPNFNARALSGKKSYLIGIVMPINTQKELENENPFYFELMLGVQKIAKELNYDVIISGILEKGEYKDFIRKRNLDGLITVGRFLEEVYTELNNEDIPVVSIDHCQNIIKNSKNIRSSDYIGGRIAAEYFINMGHKKIGVVSGNISKFGICKDRYEGFKDRLLKEKIKINKENISIGEVSYTGGIDCIKKINLENITAIFATADIMALGSMKEVVKLKKKIPEDISVIGFDDISSCKYSIPDLTSIKQHVFLKGEKSAKLLFNLIFNKKMGKEDVIVPVKLVERNSVLKMR